MLAVNFADVFGEVPAVGEPGAVYLNSQRTRGGGLRGVPCNETVTRLLASVVVGEGIADALPISRCTAGSKSTRVIQPRCDMTPLHYSIHCTSSAHASSSFIECSL